MDDTLTDLPAVPPRPIYYDRVALTLRFTWDRGQAILKSRTPGKPDVLVKLHHPTLSLQLEWIVARVIRDRKAIPPGLGDGLLPDPTPATGDEEGVYLKGEYGSPTWLAAGPDGPDRVEARGTFWYAFRSVTPTLADFVGGLPRFAAAELGAVSVEGVHRVVCEGDAVVTVTRTESGAMSHEITPVVAAA